MSSVWSVVKELNEVLGQKKKFLYGITLYPTIIEY
jgi:hypothetical protein